MSRALFGERKRKTSDGVLISLNFSFSFSLSVLQRSALSLTHFFFFPCTKICSINWTHFYVFILKAMVVASRSHGVPCRILETY